MKNLFFLYDKVIFDIMLYFHVLGESKKFLENKREVYYQNDKKNPCHLGLLSEVISKLGTNFT